MYLHDFQTLGYVLFGQSWKAALARTLGWSKNDVSLALKGHDTRKLDSIPMDLVRELLQAQAKRLHEAKDRPTVRGVGTILFGTRWLTYLSEAIHVPRATVWRSGHSHDATLEPLLMAQIEKRLQELEKLLDSLSERS